MSSDNIYKYVGPHIVTPVPGRQEVEDKAKRSEDKQRRRKAAKEASKVALSQSVGEGKVEQMEGTIRKEDIRIARHGRISTKGTDNPALSLSLARSSGAHRKAASSGGTNYQEEPRAKGTLLPASSHKDDRETHQAAHQRIRREAVSDTLQPAITRPAKHLIEESIQTPTSPADLESLLNQLRIKTNEMDNLKQKLRDLQDDHALSQSSEVGTGIESDYWYGELNKDVDTVFPSLHSADEPYDLSRSTSSQLSDALSSLILSKQKVSA